MIEMNNGQVRLHRGDSRDVLKTLADNSIDSIVCDPPYALVSIQKRFGKPGSAPVKIDDPEKSGCIKAAYARASAGFMGKDWDVGETAFAETFWAECLRVLKPGGHVVAFGGTRTYHRLVCAIEDAGFEIRDQLGWVYGSGFPKSHNQHGDWQGWGSALKPAWEPICLARKPLTGTIAGNLAEWGVGALNIDGCRVPTDETITATRNVALGSSGAGVFGAATTPGVYEQKDGGRWPANIIHDGSDEVLAAFPVTTSGAMKHEVGAYDGESVTGFLRGNSGPSNQHGDSGSAARFFYCAKASRKDRDEGLGGFEKKYAARDNGFSDKLSDTKEPRANIHPTVKPTSLMAYLCRLITPPGGTILDPFMGSGSTGKAAVLEGFNFVGIEREDEYMPIAEARIAWAVAEVAKPARPRPVVAKQPPAAATPDLFSANDNTPAAGAA